MTAFRPNERVRDEDLSFVRELVQEISGTVLGADQHYLIETRLLDLAIRSGFDGVGSLVRQLRTETRPWPLRHLAVEAMLNGETTFYRDAPCFEGLRRTVLPDLIARRQDVRRIDIWSAACSTGQEPYSIAMLLDEAFPELEGWDVRILATDLSSGHLRRARAGRYSQFEVNRGLPATCLIRHFRQEGSDWVVSEEIRSRVEFHELNLLTDWPPLESVDLVLLRNVMIYWDRAAKQRLLERVGTLLRSGGHLVLGAAETTYFVDDRFDRNNQAGSFQLLGDLPPDAKAQPGLPDGACS